MSMERMGRNHTSSLSLSLSFFLLSPFFTPLVSPSPSPSPSPWYPPSSAVAREGEPHRDSPHEAVPQGRHTQPA